MEPATNSSVVPDPLGTTINAEPLPAADLQAAPVTPESVAPVAATPGLAKKSKKPLILGLVIGGIVLLLGGSAAAYQFWYQNPDKVVTDAIMKAITAKTVSYTGSLDTTGEAAKLNVAFDGSSAGAAMTAHAKATITFGATNVVVDGSVLTADDGNLYFKVGNAKDLAASALPMLGGGSSAETDALVKKIDNRWIKISAKKDEVTPTQSAQCFSATLQKITSDTTMKSELTDLYAKQRFIKVKQSLAEKDGSLGYKLDVDQAKLKAFTSGVKTTKLYDELRKCDKDFKLDEGDIAETSDSDIATDVEVWVNKWSHELTQVKVAGQSKDDASKGTLTLKPTFNRPVSVKAPSDALPIEELQEDVTSLMQSAAVAGTSEMSSLETELDAADLDQ